MALINGTTISQLTQALPSIQAMIDTTDIMDIGQLASLRSRLDEIRTSASSNAIRDAAQRAVDDVDRQIRTVERKNTVNSPSRSRPKQSGAKEGIKRGVGAAGKGVKNTARNALMRSSIGPAIAQASSAKQSISRGISSIREVKQTSSVQDDQSTGQSQQVGQQSSDQTLTEINDKVGRIVGLLQQSAKADEQLQRSQRFAKAGRREDKYEDRLGGATAGIGAAAPEQSGGIPGALMEGGAEYGTAAAASAATAGTSMLGRGARSLRSGAGRAIGGVRSAGGKALRSVGRLGRLGGPLAGVLGGVTAAHGAHEEGRSTDQVIGAGAGGGAGALAGAAGGAALGTTVLPGVGTVIGGMIGGLAGTEVGSSIGQNIASNFAGSRSGENAKEMANQINEADNRKAYEMAEKNSVIDQNIFGSDDINDWNTVRRLNPRQITNLIRQGDWDAKTLKRLKGIRDGQSFGETIPVDIPASELSSRLSSRDVVDDNWFGASTINDWQALEQLKPGQLKKLLASTQLVPEDAKKVRGIIKDRVDDMPSMADQLSNGDFQKGLENKGVVSEGLLWAKDSIEDIDAVKEMKANQIRKMMKMYSFDDETQSRLGQIYMQKVREDGGTLSMDKLKSIGAVSTQSNMRGPGDRAGSAEIGNEGWSQIEQASPDALKTLYQDPSFTSDQKSDLARLYKRKTGRSIEQTIRDGDQAAGQQQRTQRGESRSRRETPSGARGSQTVVDASNHSRTSIQTGGGGGSSETPADRSATDNSSANRDSM